MVYPTVSRHLGCPNSMPRKQEDISLKNRVLTCNVGTWNVRTLRTRGKLENVKREMRRNKLNVLGLSEVRWKGAGDQMSEEYRIVHSGGEKCERGVAIVMDKKIGERV